MKHTRLLWLTPLLVVLAMVAAACGQKPGVHDEAAEQLPEIIIETGAGGEFVSESGSDGSTSGGESTGSGGTSGTESGGGTSGGTSGGGSGSGGDGGGDGGGDTGGDQGTQGGDAGPTSVSGSDRTGVSDDAITLAVHAPATGAAPLPTPSFEQSSDLYWRWVTETQGETVLGRSTVEVQFKDDKYTPQTAIQACRELAASSFLLVGGGGTDQIQVCGQFAEQAGVPYLSAGVTEAGLRGLDNYFATSMSYKDQGPLLAAYVKQNHGDKKVAAIFTDTPNFDDAIAGWEDGVASQGLDYFETRKHPKGSSAWINSYISDFKDANVEVVYMLTAPTNYLDFANRAADQGYTPQYVGVGISMGLNTLLASGCTSGADSSLHNGTFFSPFFGLDHARTNVPEFFEAGEQFGVPTDDIALALWGQMATIHEMFKRYEATYGSTDLTREDFVAMVETQQGIQTGVYPQLSYSPDDHFGASQVHVLKANCSLDPPEHETVATFASGF